MPMTLISRTTLTTTAASVTFNSIPQTFQTLKLVVSARSDAASNFKQVNVTFNSISANYSERLLYSNGSTALSANRATQSFFAWILQINGTTSTASSFSNAEIIMPNYAGSTNKVVSADIVNENNATAGLLYLDAALLSDTAAITSITLDVESTDNFVANSTFSLYGVS